MKIKLGLCTLHTSCVSCSLDYLNSYSTGSLYLVLFKYSPGLNSLLVQAVICISVQILSFIPEHSIFSFKGSEDYFMCYAQFTKVPYLRNNEKDIVVKKRTILTISSCPCCINPSHFSSFAQAKVERVPLCIGHVTPLNERLHFPAIFWSMQKCASQLKEKSYFKKVNFLKKNVWFSMYFLIRQSR